TVTNTVSYRRTDLVRVTVPASAVGRLVDDTGTDVPFVVEAATPADRQVAIAADGDGDGDGDAGDDAGAGGVATATGDGEAVLAFVASDVPGMGWRTWRLLPGAAGSDAVGGQAWADGAGWAPASGVSIGNEYFRVTADPARGGGFSSIREVGTGRELLRDGALGNELRVYDEYSKHPDFGEGPWHLVPNGTVLTSADSDADIRVEHSPAGQRIVVTGQVGEVTYEQRATLWHGLDRLDLRTRVLDFTGSDKLLRVKFAVDVPGARPVSEVSGAVIARGFALPDSDVATEPWTLDNPANTFFGLSSTAHLSLATPDGGDLGRAAIAIAEVVVPGLADAAPYARDLLIALARVGVTATTSTAAGTRYGWLHVDSNLPDVRIVLGGPELNPVAAELLERAGEPYRDELKRQLAERGAARVFVPAETSVEQAWLPNADLRDVRALPAVIMAGADATALAAEIAALTSEFATRASAASTAVDTGATTLLDGHTVGMLSYGIPGFAVDPSGALHLSLMRSCTGWPSGVWLDPPVRRTPDGTAFQLQHWTHDFDYALVSGAGDWRDTDLVARGQGFSTPLLARVQAAHGGDLPARHALLTVTPERQVQVQTVKPAGNPSAVGAPAVADPRAGVTVRLVETTGQPVTATVESEFGWATGDLTDLLEAEVRGPVDDAGTLHVALDGAQIATVVGAPASGVRVSGPAAAGVMLGAASERAQPVYSRYWLHNRGPAPLGFFPVSVSAEPTLLRVEGPAVHTTVTVASQYTDTEYATELTVVPPPGWTAEPERRPVVLAPNGHTSFPLELTPPDGVAPGLYFARARIGVGADQIEDVVSLLVPGGASDEILPPPAGDELDHGTQTKGTTAEAGRTTGLAIVAMDERVTVAPGGRGTVTVTVASQAADRIDGEAMPVSPWGTWGFVGPYAQGFSVEPGATTKVSFPIEVPVDAEPGHWWVMIKLMWYGRVQYAPAIPLVVTN
ncbi:MAG: glycoside hydrolase family 38 C-terminal domain-containing protein, partial [Micromonosporaceae bacterium]